MKVLPPLAEVSPGNIDPDNLRNELELHGRGAVYTPANAIAMLCEVSGFTEQQIDSLFPDLRGFKGNVRLDVSSANQPPVVISISEAPTTEQLSAGDHHIQLWYAYDATNDRAADLIEAMPGHPRNLSDAERAMDPRELRSQRRAMRPEELLAHRGRSRARRALEGSWAAPQAPISDPDTARRFFAGGAL